MKINILIAGLCALLLTACLDKDSRLPEPLASEYVKTTYSGFEIKDLKYVSYRVVYQFQKEIGPSPSYLVEFENPETNGAPFVVTAPIQSGETRLLVQSPVLPGISLKKSYKVTLRLISAGKMVDIHNDQVRFDMPDPMLKRLKINLY